MNIIPIERFSHWQELSGPDAFLSLAENPPADCPHSISGARDLGKSFTGTADLAEALTLARLGWKDAPDLRSLAGAITAKAEGEALAMEHAVTGSFVDVSRYIEGHPENMLEFCEAPAPRSIKIGINIWNHAGTAAKTFHLRGAVAIALADGIARAGMNCEIVAVNFHTTFADSKELACTTFPIKRANEPLDADAVSFWACHPSASRRIGFLTMDHYTPKNRRLFRSGPGGTGYGSYFEDFGSGLENTIPGIDLLINCEPTTEQQAAHYLETYANKLQS